MMTGSTSQESCSRPRIRPPFPSGPSFGARNTNSRYGQIQNNGGMRFRHEFFLDSDQTAIVIGRGGCIIQRIEAESAARLKMHREPREDGLKCLEITAESFECLENAKLAVKTRLESCCRPIDDNGSSASGDRVSPPAIHSKGSAVRADLPPAFMPQSGTGGRGSGVGYVGGGRSMGHHPSTAQHQSRFVNRDDVKAGEGGGDVGRAPMRKVEPQIFNSLDVPCEKAALLKGIDYPALQNQLGVRIRQSIMAPPRASRLTISGSKVKVEEAKQHLESLLREFVPVSSPSVVVGKEAVTPLPCSAGSSNSSVSEPTNEAERGRDFDRGINVAPPDVDNEPKLGGEGGAERERKEIDSGLKVDHRNSHVAARIVKAVQGLKKELKSLHAEVRELKEMDSASAATVGRANLDSVMKELSGLQIEVGKLKDKKNKSTALPICEECGVELCQVLAKTEGQLICSTKCQGCNGKVN